MTRGPFAKLYGDGENQVLVQLLDGEIDNPKRDTSIRFSWLSNLTGGVCSTSVGYDDTDEQYELAHTKFAEIDEKFARSVTEAGERMIVEAYERD